MGKRNKLDFHQIAERYVAPPLFTLVASFSYSLLTLGFLLNSPNVFFFFLMGLAYFVISAAFTVTLGIETDPMFIIVGMAYRIYYFGSEKDHVYFKTRASFFGFQLLCLLLAIVGAIAGGFSIRAVSSLTEVPAAFAPQNVTGLGQAALFFWVLFIHVVYIHVYFTTLRINHDGYSAMLVKGMAATTFTAVLYFTTNLFIDAGLNIAVTVTSGTQNGLGWIWPLAFVGSFLVSGLLHWLFFQNPTSAETMEHAASIGPATVTSLGHRGKLVRSYSMGDVYKRSGDDDEERNLMVTSNGKRHKDGMRRRDAGEFVQHSDSSL